MHSVIYMQLGIIDNTCLGTRNIWGQKHRIKKQSYVMFDDSCKRLKSGCVQVLQIIVGIDKDLGFKTNAKQ